MTLMSATRTLLPLLLHAKVLKYPSSFGSSEGESDENLNPRYSKEANISTKQQTALERLQKWVDKSDDMFNEEMDHTQNLTKDLQSLQSKYDKLLGHHETLLADHEKLSYEFPERKQDLEKLRVFDDDLQREMTLGLLNISVLLNKNSFHFV